MFATPDVRDCRPHISEGNMKMGGVPSFSTIPTDGIVRNKAGVAISEISGTCKGVCDSCKSDCYAVRMFKRTFQANLIRSWIENTILMRERIGLVKEALIAFCETKRPKSFRINVSGEIEDVTTLRMWCDVAADCKNTTFYLYTKNTAVLAEFIGDSNPKEVFPGNLHINISQWNNTVINPWGFHEFVYDDHTNPDVMNLPHCPAVDEHGKSTGIKCEQCGRCSRAEWGTKTAVHRH